ncbi:MAG: hypothetical protein Q8N57_03205 [bacterium]|nr:hypothetical protein [bacterium]
MKKTAVLVEGVIIDCSQIPKAPKKLKITLKEHKGKEVINFHLSELKTINVSSKLKKGEGYIGLEELIKRFDRNRINRPADANVLNKIVGHFQYIPKKYWKGGVYLLFLDTTYLSKKGELCVRALNYAKNGWYETVLFNSDRFAYDFVVCI